MYIYTLYTIVYISTRIMTQMLVMHALPLSLYKILFPFKAVLWESICLLLPPPHWQSLPYCITIARPLRNIRPPTYSFFLCNTPYTIGDGNLV